MENKKNAAILTVVAVATLLVAVVGATFAFFAVQGGDTQTGTITVQTYTSDSTTFSISGDLAIEADQENFASGAGNLVTGAMANVAFSPASRDSQGLCYNLKLVVSSNTFGYSDTNGTCSDNTKTTKTACLAASGTWSGEVAELTLSVAKGGTLTTGANDKITGIDSTGATVIYNGLDITNLTAGTYYIPDSLSTTIGTTRVDHTIASSVTTQQNENYAVLITFVNLNTDQSDKAGEAFNGSIVLEKCPAAQQGA